MHLHPRALTALRRHVEREWPREAGGVIRRGRFFPLENRHPEPESYWEFEADLADVEAIVHSHPDGGTWPSRQDMESQVATGLTHGIVPMLPLDGPCRGRYADPHALVKARGRAGDPFFWPAPADLPYLRRPFRFGVTDCLQLVRDWYRRELDVEIPPFAYGWDELGRGEDLFGKGLGLMDWQRVEPTSARFGDVVLLGQGGRATHCGVLVEDGLLLHHPGHKGYDPTSLSRRTPVGRLQELAVEVVRP